MPPEKASTGLTGVGKARGVRGWKRLDARQVSLDLVLCEGLLRVRLVPRASMDFPYGVGQSLNGNQLSDFEMIDSLCYHMMLYCLGHPLMPDTC